VTELALVLVLISALVHAGWNFIAKRASGGPVFTWLFELMGALVCLPLAIGVMVAQSPQLTGRAWVFVVGSAALELAYFLLLGQGYRSGDLSVVYPLARGTGPMLATVAAIALFGERPSLLALGGVVLIGVGVFVLAGSPQQLRAPNARRSVVLALFTGVVIAGYTLWDKQAVSPTGAAIPPLLYYFLLTALQAAVLTPYALTRLPIVKSEWRLHRRHALGVGVFSSLSYVLVLYALSISPVSYVAPMREIGILFGAILGWRFLAEGEGARRIAGALAMVAGVLALALG